MSETTFTDPKVIELSKNFVNIIAHRETGHGDREVLVGKEKVRLCNEYYDIPCSVHTQGDSVVGRFFKGSFGTPSTVFADPTGQEISRVAGSMSSGELLKKMNEALSKVSGEKVSLSLWQLAHKLVADGDLHLAKGDSKKAIDCYSKLGRMKGAAFKGMAEEANGRAGEAGEKALSEALALDKVEEKKKALRKIADEYKPLPVSQKARKELDSLK